MASTGGPIPTRVLGRHGPRAAQLVVDAAALTSAFVLAYLLRFDWELVPDDARAMLAQAPWVVGIELTTLHAARAHRLVWRYIALRDTFRLAAAVAAASALLLAARLALPEGQLSGARIPLGVIAIDGVLAFAAVTGVRILRRLAHERSERLGHGGPAPRRVLLLGAGHAGRLAAREISGQPRLGLEVAGFLDDDATKIGTRIQGVDVLGPTSAVAEAVRAHDVDEVVITMSRPGGLLVRRVLDDCTALGVPAEIVPPSADAFPGGGGVARLRKVDIEDLLGREPVALDTDTIRGFMRHKTAVVTGAGGSIGSELCRQLAGFTPRRLVLVDRFENALFEVHAELARRFPGLAIEPRVGDVTDRARMEAVLAEHGCDVVFHAAAHKHVPMMEANPGEAVKNNAGGTRVMADVAHARGAGHFVLVSTDKAVRPASVMGATKRMAELYVQAMARHSRTVFVSVRFGNVLGSAGSVVPLFRRQIAAGGPVTVTHPEMCRYFMTVAEASQLVLEAATLGRGGEVLILDMGRPVRIVDLARDLIALSGLRPGDVELRFTGVRPGEKLSEELSTDEENAVRTRHPAIWVGRLPPAELHATSRAIDSLLAVASSGDPGRIRAALQDVVPDYHPAPAGTAAARAAEPSRSRSA